MPLLLALALAALPTPRDVPRTYLVSIVDLPLRADEALMHFEFATWGVRVNAVCRIPAGWRITAGGSATPDGEIAGTGSHGVTWFRDRRPAPLRNLVLVTLDGPVQPAEIRTSDGVIPATFRGKAEISDRDDTHWASLSSRNIRLVRARRCPQPR